MNNYDDSFHGLQKRQRAWRDSRWPPLDASTVDS